MTAQRVNNMNGPGKVLAACPVSHILAYCAEAAAKTLARGRKDDESNRQKIHGLSNGDDKKAIFGFYAAETKWRKRFQFLNGQIFQAM